MEMHAGRMAVNEKHHGIIGSQIHRQYAPDVLHRRVSLELQVIQKSDDDQHRRMPPFLSIDYNRCSQRHDGPDKDIVRDYEHPPVSIDWMVLANRVKGTSERSPGPTESIDVSPTIASTSMTSSSSSSTILSSPSFPIVVGLADAASWRPYLTTETEKGVAEDILTNRRRCR